MTELRRLSESLSNVIRPAVDRVLSDGGVADRHEALLRLRTGLAECVPKVLRMLSRAREKDPEKQLFNERTCGAIEDLYRSFLEELSRLHEVSAEAVDAALTADGYGTMATGPVVEELELCYAEHMLREAAAEAHRHAAATSLSALEEAEERERRLIQHEQHALFARELLPAARSNRMDAQRRQELRELAVWHVEVARRAEEAEALAARADAPAAAATAMQALFSVDPKACAAICQRLVDLLRELSNHPENQNIRTIRNNSLSAIAAFGHPCLPDVAPLWRHVETILATVNYVVHYTQTPSVVYLETIESLAVPNGTLHWPRYRPLGFERYGERALALREPSVENDPDGWCLWHASLEETIAILAGGLCK